VLVVTADAKSGAERAPQKRRIESSWTSENLRSFIFFNIADLIMI
jgi:hypothetical protein